MSKLFALPSRDQLPYYGCALSSGLLLAGITFMQNAWVQTLSLVVLVPVLWALACAKKTHGYNLGLVFFAAWLMPTTYWYYGFMPPWLAFLASFGFAALLANLFFLKFISNKRWIVLISLLLAWPIFTYIHLHAPVMEDWWLPNLGYAVWRNSALLQAGHWFGSAGIEFAVLLPNVVITLLLLRKRRTLAVIVAGLCLVSAIGANVWIYSAKSNIDTPNIISVQALPVNGVDAHATNADVASLEQTTLTELSKLPRNGKPTWVIWPENSFTSEDMEQKLALFATQQHIYLTYNGLRSNSDKPPYKMAVTFNDQGEVISRNYKKHVAPGESITEATGHNHFTINGQQASAYVCYDMHYPDISQRISGAKLIAAELDDAEFGQLQKQFHFADIALRAVENRAAIVISSTDGPTGYIDEYGVVRQELTFKTDSVIVLNADN